MNETIYITTALVLILFSSSIQPWLNRRYPEGRLPIHLMVVAVASALVLVGTIDAVAEGILPAAGFFVILSTIVAYFLYYGITHRHEVAQNMRRTYYRLLVSYSYVFVVSGVLMFVFLPFMPNIIL